MTERAAEVFALQAYEPNHAEAWDHLVARSSNGSMLHTRRFLSYHKDRLHDCSVIIENRGRLVGVFPAAEDPDKPAKVVSHPGLTFGGLIHDGSIRGAPMIHALRQIVSHYRTLGYRHLRYKAVPAIYHSSPAEDDTYALFSLGVHRNQCDLSVAINLAYRGHVSQRRVRSLRRAELAAVSTDVSWTDIAGFWEVLQLNLAKRHGASPVHSVEEISFLHERFPDEIVLITAKIGGVLAGGALFFSTGPVLRMQYTATTGQGRASCVTDAVIEHAIRLARKRNCTFLDFGGCTLDLGRSLYDDLYYFKASFGGGGVVYEQYECEL